MVSTGVSVSQELELKDICAFRHFRCPFHSWHGLDRVRLQLVGDGTCMPDNLLYASDAGLLQGKKTE